MQVLSTDTQLEVLARSIITESLIELKRPSRALRNFLATLPLYDQSRGRPTQLKVGYLKARLLDAYGYARESEKTFRNVINGLIEEGLYKTAAGPRRRSTYGRKPPR